MTLLRNVNCVRFSRHFIQGTRPNCKSISSGLKVCDNSNEKVAYFCQKEKYISEVIANFVELGETRPKNIKNKNYEKKKENTRPILKSAFQTKSFNRAANKVRSYDKSTTSSNENHCVKSDADALLTYGKNKTLNYNKPKLKGFNNVDLSNYGTGLEIKDKIDLSEVDKEINYLLDKKKTEEAFHIFNNYKSIKVVPSYRILRALTSAVSFTGNSSRVKLLQEVAKCYYPKEFCQDLCFTHYLCEATFREGDYSVALSMLRICMEKYPKTRRLKEIASYIMKQMVEAPEELADEAFNIACNFISSSNQAKPAYSLWYCMVQSNYHKHRCVANDLLDFYPHLLDGREGKSNELIEKAFLDDNVELLHRLNECFLKIDNKQLVTAVSSSMLSLYSTSVPASYEKKNNGDEK